MSTVPPIPTYAFDPEGTSSANLIPSEQQILTGAGDRDFYFIVPRCAPYFEDSMVISLRDANGNVTPLNKDTDYYATNKFDDASWSTAKPIFGTITFLNTALTGTVTLSYQTLGGDWVLDDAKYAAVLADTIHNPRITSWEFVANLPYAFPPIAHDFDLTKLRGFDALATAVDSATAALLSKSDDDLIAHENDFANPHRTTAALVGAYSKGETNTLIAQLLAVALQNHVSALDSHPNYLNVDRGTALVQQQSGLVRLPVNLAPANGTTAFSLTGTLQGSQYYSLYGVAQAAAQFQVSKVQDFSSQIVVDSGTLAAVTSFAVPTGLASNNNYFWRARYRDAEGVWSQWSTPTAFSTGSILVTQPSITSPINGATGISTGPTLTSSAFAVTGGTDTQASADWELWTGPIGTGTKAFGIYNATGNKLSVAIPAGTLTPNTVYYARVRHTGLGAGVSSWSNDVRFTTAGIITKPTLIAPLTGSTNQPDTLTITTSAFAVTGGTDTQASADFQVWSGPNGTGTKVWEDAADTVNLTTVQMPAGKLAVNTVYYARARHTGAALGPSAWSDDSSFTTAANFVPTVAGTPYGGGFYVCNYTLNGDTYALIVSPKASGEFLSLWNYSLQNSLTDGAANTDAAFNGNGGASGSGVSPKVKAMTVGGFSDWYVPSHYELMALYRAMKPSSAANTLDSVANQFGISSANPYTVPPGPAFTATVPAVTTVKAFLLGGTDVLQRANLASSSVALKPGSAGQGLLAIATDAINGYTAGQIEPDINSGTSMYFRAIRKIKISS